MGEGLSQPAITPAAGAKAQGSRRNLALAAVAAIACVAGWAGWVFSPFFSGGASVPVVVYVFAALTVVWMALFARKAARSPRRFLDIEFKDIMVALAVAYAAPRAGASLVERDLAAGLGDGAYSAYLAAVAAALVFETMAAAAFFNRDIPDARHRFLLLATLALLWPALLGLHGFFPGAPHPGMLFAAAPAAGAIALAMLGDLVLMKRIDPVYGYAGVAAAGLCIAGALAYDTPHWRAASKALYAAVAPS